MNGRDKILKEALDAYQKNKYNGVVLLPTGTGKGRLMVELAKILKPESILYLSNSTQLRDKMFIDELHKWDGAHLLKIMDRECYQTVYKWRNRKYDLVLADEFDAALTDKYSEVFKYNTFKYKVLVSATLDDDKRIKAKRIAPIIYEKKTEELIDEQVLNKIQFYFINYDLSGAENKGYLEYNERFKTLLNKPQNGLTKQQLERVQIQRKQFLSSLKSSAEVTKWLVDKLMPKQQKILIFCGLSEQADKVCKNSYHSNNDNEQALIDFQTGKEKIISVVDKITRGVNIQDVRNIIFESTGRSKTKITQRIGRGLRLRADETLNVFFLVPYFKHPFYGKKATVVQDWILASTKDMNIANAKSINYTQNK